MCCSSLLLMYLWQSLLVCFGSLFCKPCFRWDSMMLQYPVITSLIQFVLHLVQIPNFAKSKPTHTITEPPPCFMVSVIQTVKFFHQLFATHRTPYLTPKFQTLIHQSKGLYSTTLLFSLLTLFCFLNSSL